MYKIIFFCALLLIFFSFLALTTKTASAVTVSPSPIGDINIGEKKTVTISGLAAGRKYVWKESRRTGVIPIENFTAVFMDCYNADSGGSIEKDLGPFSIPGIYLLEVYLTTTNTTRCESVGTPRVSERFSVGGPTGKSCCTPLFPAYDKDKDVCKKQLITLPGQPNPEISTECKKESSYCEPESLQCFTTKTSVQVGKICGGSDDIKRDPNKYAICSTSGGNPCDQNNKDNPGIQTAIGCVHTSPVGFIKDFLKFILGIAGGLAFLMMLLGAFQMLTSAGNPDTLAAGRDKLSSAVIGLLFVIFSVLLLQIIGVDILGLPGFTK